MKWIAFFVYLILWEALVWLGGFYLILERGWSGWWIVLMVLLSAAQYKFNREENK